MALDERSYLPNDFTVRRSCFRSKSWLKNVFVIVYPRQLLSTASDRSVINTLRGRRWPTCCASCDGNRVYQQQATHWKPKMWKRNQNLSQSHTLAYNNNIIIICLYACIRIYGVHYNARVHV